MAKRASSTTPTLAQAQATLTDAQARLEAALIDGTDTTQIRAEIAAAESEIARIRAVEAERARAPRPKSDQEIRAEALAQGIADSLRETMTAIVGSVQVPPAPVPDLAAALALIEAQDRHAENHQAHTEAESKSARLQDRLDALNNERNLIVERRASGKVQDDDPANLARLDADIEGVGHLLDSATATLAEKARTAKNADQELAEADRLWKREGVFNATCDAYQALADTLLGALAAVGRVMPADAWSFRDPTRFDVSFGIMQARLAEMNVRPPIPVDPPVGRGKSYAAVGGQRLPSF